MGMSADATEVTYPSDTEIRITHWVGVPSTPVVVRHGEQDVMVPAAHGRWLAANVPERDRLGGAAGRSYEGAADRHSGTRRLAASLS